MCQSALDMASSPDNIEFLSYHDEDDKSPYDYIGNHKEIIGPRTSSTSDVTCLHEIATGPIYMGLCDDIIFETKDWDKYIEEEFEKYPDKIVLVVPDSKQWDVYGFGGIVCVHKNWLDIAGYPTQGEQRGDAWLHEVASAIGREVRLMTVRIEHQDIKDKIHSEKNKRGRREEWTKKYKTLTEGRNKEVEKLKEFICNFQS